MDENAAPHPNKSMPESVETDSAHTTGKRRWTDEDEPEANTDTDSDEISMFASLPLPFPAAGP
jgi:hypothetical protein